jgi:hypothetical protein
MFTKFLLCIFIYIVNDDWTMTIVKYALGTNNVIGENLAAMFRIAKGATWFGPHELGSGSQTSQS